MNVKQSLSASVLSVWVFLGACTPTSNPAESSPSHTQTLDPQRDPQSSSIKIDTLKIAIIPASGNRPEAYQELESYLSEALGLPVTVEFSESYEKTIQDLVNEDVYLAYLGPFSYVKAKQQNSALEPVVTSIQGDTGRPWYTSLIVTRRETGIQSLEAIRGKRFGFVNQSSTSGFLVPTGAFKALSLDPMTDFAGVEFTGGHDKSLAALLAGTVDAIAINNTLYREAIEAGKITEAEVPILWESDPIPGSPIVINTKLSPDL